MKKVDKYFKLQKEIYEYFGYKEDWVVFPLEDRREMYWKISKTIGYVKYSPQKDFTNEDTLYEDEIYTQRFLPKWVYRGKKYTMIVVDTHTDGNRFLAIYDNKKKLSKERILE